MTSTTCWNCERQVAEESVACPTCEVILYPDAEQKQRAEECIHYTLREIRRWTSVPAWWKSEAEANYKKRLMRLAREMTPPAVATPSSAALNEAALDEVAQVEAPEPPLVVAAQAPVEAMELPLAVLATPPLEEPPAETEPPVEPSEADLAMQMLLGAFSEKKIRLLYAVGGALLVSAGVGTLRSSWDGWGRHAMGLLLLLLPVVFFWLSRRLQTTLPVSSRMFSTLGGGLAPLGILSLNALHVMGLDLPARLWSPFAFFIGWALNAGAGHPYLAGICWALAGLSSGSSLFSGLLCFGGAGALFATRRQQPEAVRVAHGLSAWGLLSAFIHNPQQVEASSLFLVAIVYFTSTAWLVQTPAALVASSLISLFSSLALAHSLEAPVALTLLTLMIQGAFYLSRRESSTGQRLAIEYTGLAMAVLWGLPLFYHLTHQFQGVPTQQLLTSLLLGMAGTAYYAWAARVYRQPQWSYGAALCAIYAYLHFIALGQLMYRPWLVGLALLWQMTALVLRRRVSQDVLRPWVWTATGLSVLLVPLNGALQLAGADLYTPWIYLGVAAVTVLSALFERSPKGLYFSGVVAALAYATWLPIWLPRGPEPNLGLAFTPFATALLLLGLALRQTPAYAAPLLHLGTLLSLICSASQLPYIAFGYRHSPSVTLFFYAGTCLLAAWKQPTQRSPLTTYGALCALTALELHVPTAVTLGLSALLLLPQYTAANRAGWIWSAGVAWLGPAPLRILPCLLWLYSSRHHRERALQASLLALPALPGCYQDWSNLGLAAFTAGQLWLGRRWSYAELYTVSWLQLKLVIFNLLGWPCTPAWSLLLWADYALFRWLRCKHEAYLSLALVLTSALIHGGPVGVATPWLAALLSPPYLAIWAALTTAYHLETVALFPICLFLWCYFDLYRGRVAHLQAFILLGWIGCLLVADLSLCLLSLALGAGLLALQRQFDATFALGYHAYLRVLVQLEVSQAELYTLPLSLFLLGKSSTAARQLGLTLMLAPSLWLSLFSPAHALWAASLGMLLLMWGQLKNRPALQAWGALAILLQIAIRAVIFASYLPWHYWAVVGGLLLVTMAFMVERRRQQVLEASRTFLDRLRQV